MTTRRPALVFYSVNVHDQMYMDHTITMTVFATHVIVRVSALLHTHTTPHIYDQKRRATLSHGPVAPNSVSSVPTGVTTLARLGTITNGKGLDLTCHAVYLRKKIVLVRVVAMPAQILTGHVATIRIATALTYVMARKRSTANKPAARRP